MVGNPIAHLFDGVSVYCLACRLPTEMELKSRYPPCRLWREFIRPKKQSCHQCNKILVEGSDSFDELFPRESNHWATILYNVVQKEMENA